LVKVTRIDQGDGNKSFPQYHWNGTAWVKVLNEQVKSQIRLYRIQDPINQVAITTGQPVLIVEGEGKVDLLLQIGIAATCSIGGAGAWRSYGYPNYLEDLAGANVVLCPDRDKAGLKHCEDIALDFPDAKWLYVLPNFPLWQRVPNKGGFDIADWVTDDGATREEMLGAIGDKRQELEKLIAQPDELAHSTNDEDKVCKLARQFQEVQAVLGHRLRLNTLRKQIELDEEPINPDRIHLKLANDFNLQIPRSNALDIVTELAEQRAYSPVVEYLTRVYNQHGGNGDILKTIASRYFGTDNPIYDTYLQKILVAAAARAMQPGCKMDTALILQGKQGVGKSSFFKVLAGEDWFDDSLGHISDKDERLKLHVTWFIEWAELESVFKRRDLASVKAFLTCSRDYIRPPYGRSVQAFDRPSIIVGTTNQDEFLGDSTGNRRFWVIPVQQEVDLKLLRTERDRI
jgi:predicted P-loop ATPase